MSRDDDDLDGMRITRSGGGHAYVRPGTTIREYVRATETGGRWGLGEVQADPDESVVTHAHPEEPEALVILEGPVELHGANATTVLNTGDVVFIPPGTAHGLRTPRGGRWLAVWPPSLDGLFEELEKTADAVAAARLRVEHGMVPGQQRHSRRA